MKNSYEWQSRKAIAPRYVLSMAEFARIWPGQHRIQVPPLGTRGGPGACCEISPGSDANSVPDNRAGYEGEFSWTVREVATGFINLRKRPLTVMRVEPRDVFSPR